MKRFLTFAIILSAVGCGISDKGKLPEEEAQAYRDKGAEIVQLTGSTLVGKLTKAIADTGIVGAIEYCNVNAYPIVDSVSKANGVVVRRTSVKYRNPNNKPSDFEKKLLGLYKHAKEKGEELKPQIGIDQKGMVTYYQPITVQSLCLNCHGTQDNGYARATFNKVNELYPDDKAFNYKLGDLRGMWVVKFSDSTSSSK